MKKMRKGKKMLLILLITILVAIAVFGIIYLVKKVAPGPSEQPIDDTPQAIALPETTYSDMEVKNINMILLKENASDGGDETKVSMEIHNTTEEKVVDEFLDAVLIGPDDEVIGQMQTWIHELNPGEQYKMEVILKGDLTATTQIKLIKK